MQSRWNDAEAAAMVAEFAAAASGPGTVGEELALRVYTSRLIGRDPDLVLHGGGNTSCKTAMRDVLGREVEVLCVKGSGHDLGAIGPAGLPPLRLQPLRELRALEQLGDADMVAAMRSAMLDPGGPQPSVETLLHAFLPHAFVDHTHADAILALTDQPDGDALARQCFGDEVAVLPWIMPGFPLAKAVAAAFEAAPQVRGIVLLKHGLFTFAKTARDSYEAMVELVDRAERFVQQRIGELPAMLAGRPAPLPAAADAGAGAGAAAAPKAGPVLEAALPADSRHGVLARALPVLRGAVAMQVGRPWGAQWRRVVADLRSGDEVAAFAAHPDAAALCTGGPITPDHVIRTKGRYLFLTREQALDGDRCRAAVAGYVGWYKDYFDRCVRPRGIDVMLAPMPQVAVIEGCGVVALQPSRKAAAIAADIAEHTLKVWAMGRDLGRFEALTPEQLAAMEYWPLELGKLGKAAEPPLQGQVALVTGAAGAIGCGIAEALLEAGACVLAVDLDAERLGKVTDRLRRCGDRLQGFTADLTDATQVERAFQACALAFGGVDVVVPNAGIAHQSRLEDMDRDRFEAVLAVNTTGTMLVLQQAAKLFRAQRTGGSVVLQASKNAFAPGQGFGAYSASKAAALQLGRIAALEFAELGVAVNMINADAVFGDDEVPSQLWQLVGPERMRARNLDPDGLRQYYRDRSLLKTTVLPRHVGEAVVFFASQRTPTTGAVLPVDGGLPEAFPR